MLPRSSQSQPTVLKWIRKGAAILFVAEAAAFGTSYFLWARMNTDRDFRQYMNDQFPAILDGYYKVGEYMSGSKSARNVDYEYWRHSTPKDSTSDTSKSN